MVQVAPFETQDAEIQSAKTCHLGRLALVSIALASTACVGVIIILIIGFSCPTQDFCFKGSSNKTLTPFNATTEDPTPSTAPTSTVTGNGQSTTIKTMTPTITSTISDVTSSAASTTAPSPGGWYCWKKHKGICTRNEDEACPYIAKFDETACQPNTVCCVPRGKKAPTNDLPSRPNCGEVLDLRFRILGGWKTRQWPFIASLRTANGTHFCGATIISPTFLITAAHCVHDKKPGDLSVVTGEQDLNTISGHEKTFEVEKIIVHPDYNFTEKLNDLALLQLQEQVKMDMWRQPACLPVAADSFKTLQDDGFAIDVCLALGWGSDLRKPFVNHLKAVALPLYNAKRCKEMHDLGSTISDTNIIPGKNICTYLPGSDTCTGDSGGPLLGERNNRFILVGVIVWGDRQCGQVFKPGVYALVSGYMSWITTEVKDLPANGN